MKVAIAGASGFIGTALLGSLSTDPRIDAIYALSRNARKTATDTRITWKKVDLANLEILEAVLEGAEYALYLVHSMSPQAKLSQGTFEDFDLFQADNFSRACHRNGIRNIFYLGGIVQEQNIDSEKLSAHLKSRLEVERVLGAYGAKVTALRAGLIMGRGGSSSEMLIHLVRRLPFMFVPRWTRTESEPVDLSDVIRGIHSTLFRADLQGSVWELVGPERITYSELMFRAASALGLKRLIIPLPIISPTISKLWVALISGAPRALVYPLVKSLTHPMLSVPERRLSDRLGLDPTPLDVSLKRLANSNESRTSFPIRSTERRTTSHPRKTVRSIQRISNLTPEKMKEVGSLAESYFRWLPQFLFGLLRVEKVLIDNRFRLRFKLRFTSLILLELTATPISRKDIERFAITGGLLQIPGSGGFLEFRVIPSENCGLSSVQDFVPRLPWVIYASTQALLHVWIMRRFARSLIV